MYQREVLVVVNYICTVVLYSLFFFLFYEIYILAPTVIKEKRIVRKSFCQNFVNKIKYRPKLYYVKATFSSTRQGYIETELRSESV